MDRTDLPTPEVLLRDLLEITVARTGYPEEMLELDLDLEADLGIDTVKQVAIFAALRERHGIERDPNVAIRELSTLRRAHAHFVERCQVPAHPSGPAQLSPHVAAMPDVARAEPPTASPPPSVSSPRSSETAPEWEIPVTTVAAATAEGLPSVAAATASPLAPPGAGSGAIPHSFEAVLAILVGHAVEKTGYPEEMLEPDLDLEADLGIDTVKQVAIFGKAREQLGVERDPNVSLRSLNTLRKAARHLHERAVALASITQGGAVTSRGASALAPPLTAPPPASSAPTPTAAPRVHATVPSSTTTSPEGAVPSAVQLSAFSLQTSGQAGTRATREAPAAVSDAHLREALLTMDFDTLGIDYQAVQRLAQALAQRMGVTPPAVLPSLRSFRALLAHLEAGRGGH